MANFVIVASVSDVPAGSMKTVIAAGRPIALANIAGQYFAVDDVCTHAQCSLGSEGFLDGNNIICGCHGAQFDATTGKVLTLPAPTSLSSYLVKVEGEDILVA